jgi:hypothetical protein
MKKIVFFILFTSLSLMADGLPNGIKTTVQDVSNGTIELSTNVPAGMSGIVIHNYGNRLQAITYDTISLGGNKASIKPHNAITHGNIPSIQTPIHKGDTIIFGHFYKNALLIAPNHPTYQQLTKKFNRVWTHPDVFALEFIENSENSLTMEVLNNFAEKYQVGLVLVVTQNELLIIDPLSQNLLGQMAYTPNTTQIETPFYARFEPLSSSLFSSNKTYVPYFQSVTGLK